MRIKRRLLEGAALAGIGMAALLLTSCESQTAAAPPTQTACLVEGMAFNRVQVDAAMTKHCQDRINQGWRLVSAGMGGLVWVK